MLRSIVDYRYALHQVGVVHFLTYSDHCVRRIVAISCGGQLLKLWIDGEARCYISRIIFDTSPRMLVRGACLSKQEVTVDY